VLIVLTATVGRAAAPDFSYETGDFEIVAAQRHARAVQI
jgi:hypothetical protein